ncbi:carbohydrate sulfotransferase 14-like [Antedon mediterranea]|uniref:carbohydrate sulfotransferase 14-like n=1 Tax=Antedon mediterranea TaxID=105859 RepID=UPI003AF4410B
MSMLSREEIQLKMETYRKAMFVRNPITRFLSLYLSKFVTSSLKTRSTWEEYIGTSIIARYRKNSMEHKLQYKLNLNITFYEFSSYIVDVTSNYAIDEITDHWLPMHKSCDPCRFKPDFIGYFEELETEGPYLLQWLGIDGAVQLPKYHVSTTGSQLRNEYSKIGRNKLRKLINYYAHDYNLFGYSTEAYLL